MPFDPPDPTKLQALAAACTSAREWLGATAPNPPVGAVAINAQGEIIATAAHRCAGEAHAEALLLEQLRAQGKLADIDTLYVTLEPCNHHGRTPPCTEAIIGAGIKRVVIGARDPNPQVAGGGIEKLRAAGIEVVLRDDEECKQLIHAFAFRMRTGKPWITVKRAFRSSEKESTPSPCGRVAPTLVGAGWGKNPDPPPAKTRGLHTQAQVFASSPARGEGALSMIPPAGQKTFTSPASLRLAHQLRKKADAIITGSGTILADNPLFTVRHVQDHPGKKRWLAILDRRGRVPESYLAAAREHGLEPLVYKDIQKAIDDLATRGAQDVLVEAGPALSQAMLDAGLWTMSVGIHQGDPDRVETVFNPDAPVPFDTAKFAWDYFLPA